MLDMKIIGKNLIRVIAIAIVGIIGMTEPMQMILTPEIVEKVVEGDWDFEEDEAQNISDEMLFEDDIYVPDEEKLEESEIGKGSQQEVLAISPTATPIEEFSYTSYDEYIKIDAYNGTRSEVEIPNVIDGLPVKVISYDAFANNEILEKVIIPDTVIHIYSGAFSNCQLLASVIFEKRGEIPVGETGIISSDAFFNTAITEITIPGYYSEVAMSFNGCKNLTKFVWEESEDGVTSQELSSYTFDGCDALKELHLSGTVKDISLGKSDDWGDVIVYAPMDSPAWNAAVEEGLAVQEE